MPSEAHDNIVQLFKAQRAAGATQAPGIDQLREGYELLAQMVPPAENIGIVAVDAGGVPAERIVPRGADERRCVVYLHGGGYCIGSLNTHRHVASAIAIACGSTALVVDYRLAPEHVFPAAVDDAVAAYRWVLEQGIAPSSIAVAGDSAGGGLAGAMQIALRDRKDPVPAASSLHSPYADLSTLGEVSPEALETDWLRPETIAFFEQTYVPEGDRKVPLASPVYADLSGLGPMLIQAGGAEILLDTARRLAARAKDCGVDVTLEVEPGLSHAWHHFIGIVPEAAETVARVGSFFRECWT